MRTDLVTSEARAAPCGEPKTPVPKRLGEISRFLVAHLRFAWSLWTLDKVHGRNVRKFTIENCKFSKTSRHQIDAGQALLGVSGFSQTSLDTGSCLSISLSGLLTGSDRSMPCRNFSTFGLRRIKINIIAYFEHTSVQAAPSCREHCDVHTCQSVRA